MYRDVVLFSLGVYSTHLARDANMVWRKLLLLIGLTCMILVKQAEFQVWQGNVACAASTQASFGAPKVQP